MSILLVLILHSSSNQAPPTFVTVGDNYTLSLFSDAKKLLQNSSFLVLATGSSPAKNFLLNSLLLGPPGNSTDPGFFALDGPNPIELRFPYHRGISLAAFCAKWKLDCIHPLPNRTIVFISSPGDGSTGTNQRDARRISAAFSSIISCPIIVTPEWRPSLSELDTLTQSGILDAFLCDRDANRVIAVVVPQFVVAHVTNTTTDAEYDAARRMQDALFTASLHRFFQRASIQEQKRSAVFVQPDPDRWRNGFWASMRELAGFIAREACETEPLNLEDAEWLLEAAVQWPRTDSGDCIPLRDFIRARATKVLREIQSGLVAKTLAAIEFRLWQRYRAFEVDSDAKDDSEAAYLAAVDEFGREFDALPWVLRVVVGKATVDLEMNDLRGALRVQVPVLVMRRQQQLEEQFESDCSIASETIITDAKEELGWLAQWSSRVEAEWIGRFSRAVHYKDLPPQMQRSVEHSYRYWSQITAMRLRDQVESRRSVWPGVILSLIIFLAVMLCRGAKRLFDHREQPREWRPIASSPLIFERGMPDDLSISADETDDEH